MKNSPQESLQPIQNTEQTLGRRLSLKAKFVLALLPTVLVLAVFAFVEVFTRQRLLFASLASSAFLIYLDPHHETNSTRSLILSQTAAALAGWGMFVLLGPGYLAAGAAMVLTIVVMILLDVVHPPAVATSLSFAFKAGPESNLVLFGLAVGLITTLVLLQKASVWLLARSSKAQESGVNREIH